MFRAGKLSNLEEIRESALAKIVLKMQAHVRKCLVAVTFKAKAAEKKAIFSIQNNIRNYYRCKNWPWYVIADRQDRNPSLSLKALPVLICTYACHKFAMMKQRMFVARQP